MEIFTHNNLKCLGELIYKSMETYSDDLHFINELLQNSDDSSCGPIRDRRLLFYVSNTTPKGLLIPDPDNHEDTTDYGCLMLLCNENGFTQEDVDSISSAGLSTSCGDGEEKTHTGEKGIGFKSCFKITHTPFIFSRGFHFYFNTKVSCLNARDYRIERGLSMIRRVHCQDGLFDINEFPVLINAMKEFDLDGTFSKDSKGTLFVFPFINDEWKSRTYSKIKGVLSHNLIINLKNISRIDVYFDDSLYESLQWKRLELPDVINSDDISPADTLFYEQTTRILGETKKVDWIRRTSV